MSTRFDEENVLRMLQEDDAIQRRAFGMIVDEYGQQLYWQIRRLVLNHDDANDVLQETLIQAWKNIDYFRGESKLSTWLYRIAINQSLNFLNKQKAQQCISMDNEEQSVVNQLEEDPYFDGDKAQRLLQQAHYESFHGKTHHLHGTCSQRIRRVRRRRSPVPSPQRTAPARHP